MYEAASRVRNGIGRRQGDGWEGEAEKWREEKNREIWSLMQMERGEEKWSLTGGEKPN